MSSTLVEKVSIRMTSEEKRMAESLARFLKQSGNIESATISNAMRASLHFTVSEVLKGIEKRRYAR